MTSSGADHSRTLSIRNKYGLHARPAAEFVKRASRYRCDVWVSKDDLEVNGKSIMGIMMLAAEAGSEITIRAAGEDAVDALEALCELIEQRFGEE